MLEQMFEDVDTDESGALSPQEVHSYAFFNELQRRVALSRRSKVKEVRNRLVSNVNKVKLMGNAVILSTHVHGHESVDHEEDAVDDEMLARSLSSAVLEQKHDSERTVHVGRIPSMYVRDHGSYLTELFTEFGKVCATQQAGVRETSALFTHGKFLTIHCVSSRQVMNRSHRCQLSECGFANVTGC
jgi:hypothetical protein